MDITLVIICATAIFCAESNDAVSKSLAPVPGPTLDVSDFTQDMPLHIAELTSSNAPEAFCWDAEQICGTDTVADTDAPPMDAVIETDALSANPLA